MVLHAILNLAFAGQSFSKRLADGASVRVEAVVAEKSGRIWSPDGGADRSPYTRTISRVLVSSANSDKHARAVLLSVSGAPNDPSVVCKFASGPARAAAEWHSDSRDGRVWLGLVEGNSRDAELKLNVGIADGPWKTIGSVSRSSDGKVIKAGVGFFRMARPWVNSNEPVGQRAQVIVDTALPTDSEQHAYDVVLFDRNGARLKSFARKTIISSLTREFWFSATYDRVARVELLMRTYTWITIPNVRINPKK